MSSRGRKSSIVLNENSNKIQIPTFHHGHSETCVRIIAEFSAKHREDKNKDFKTAWKLWIQTPEVKNVFAEESNRLVESGYAGDVMEKLYFSARYYHRKKAIAAEKTAPVQEKTRKPHEATDASVLEKMNRDILQQIQLNNKIRPAEAFENYKQCTSFGEDEAKIKKIYKNRFFMIRKKLEKLSD
jgi:hypothetical protein